jgi:uncharacterized protein Smg (DUF494 family)
MGPEGLERELARMERSLYSAGFQTSGIRFALDGLRDQAKLQAAQHQTDRARLVGQAVRLMTERVDPRR